MGGFEMFIKSDLLPHEIMLLHAVAIFRKRLQGEQRRRLEIARKYP